MLCCVEGEACVLLYSSSLVYNTVKHRILIGSGYDFSPVSTVAFETNRLKQFLEGQTDIMLLRDYERWQRICNSNDASGELRFLTAW